MLVSSPESKLKSLIKQYQLPVRFIKYHQFNIKTNRQTYIIVFNNYEFEYIDIPSSYEEPFEDHFITIFKNHYPELFI